MGPCRGTLSFSTTFFAVQADRAARCQAPSCGAGLPARQRAVFAASAGCCASASRGSRMMPCPVGGDVCVFRILLTTCYILCLEVCPFGFSFVSYNKKWSFTCFRGSRSSKASCALLPSPRNVSGISSQLSSPTRIEGVTPEQDAANRLFLDLFSSNRFDNVVTSARFEPVKRDSLSCQVAAARALQTCALDRQVSRTGEAELARISRPSGWCLQESWNSWHSWLAHSPRQEVLRAFEISRPMRCPFLENKGWRECPQVYSNWGVKVLHC